MNRKGTIFESCKGKYDQANSQLISKLNQKYPLIEPAVLRYILEINNNDLDLCLKTIEENIKAQVYTSPAMPLRDCKNDQEHFDKVVCKVQIYKRYPEFDDTFLNEILESVGYDMSECMKLLDADVARPKRKRSVISETDYNVSLLNKYKAYPEENIKPEMAQFMGVVFWLEEDKFRDALDEINDCRSVDKDGVSVLDLHFKTRNEANLLFNTFVFLMFIELMRSKKKKFKFKVFTGRGIHSAKKPVLLTKIKKIIDQLNLTHDHYEEGKFLLTIKRFE